MSFWSSAAHRAVEPPPASTRTRGRARWRDQRGVELIEAALVFPIFFLMLFGIIEFGLAISDYLGTGNAVRAGARTASATGNDYDADYSILQTVRKESTALSRGDIQLIVIYKASGVGSAPDSLCQAGTAHDSGSGTTACNVYTSADLSRARTDFGVSCVSPSIDRYYCPTNRKVTQSGTGADYIGVWMKVRHRYVTNFFGSAKTLTDSSVIRLEPRLLT